ncbi:MAG: TlpA family protein disulfide reductase [Cocleimonas sp.]|nr:TlpA family protein disulfide reductase [Cocleimonas sp.]
MQAPFSFPVLIRLKVILLLFVLILPLSSSAKTPLVGQAIPNLRFIDMKERIHYLSEYRGKWLFINFWASYCSICEQEIPTLIRFQQLNKAKVALLGVNFSAESLDAVKVAMHRHRFNYPIVPDQTLLSKTFNDIFATPTTLVISPTGHLVEKVIGRLTLEELNAFIKPLQQPVEDVKQSSHRIWNF